MKIALSEDLWKYWVAYINTIQPEGIYNYLNLRIAYNDSVSSGVPSIGATTYLHGEEKDIMEFLLKWC